MKDWTISKRPQKGITRKRWKCLKNSQAFCEILFQKNDMIFLLTVFAFNAFDCYF